MGRDSARCRGAHATNALIAISECDCKQGCNLWLGTVSVSDSMSASDEGQTEGKQNHDVVQGVGNACRSYFFSLFGPDVV